MKVIDKRKKEKKCPCCDFDSDGFGKNIIGKGYGSCEIRLLHRKSRQYTLWTEIFQE